MAVKEPSSATSATAMTAKSTVHALSARQVIHLIRQDQLSIESYATALLTRIEEREPVVKAWAHVDPTQVLAQARLLDDVPLDKRGPLHGVAVGIKDVLLSKDMPTRYGSPIFEYDPAFGADSAVVAALRSAGALVVGKTRTTEFAATATGGPCQNPICPDRTPGGSSSGSAAAVADGHVPLAIGTQTGGSMVRPGAYCGVWAFKPTWNTVATEGMSRCSIHLDTIGYFGRTLEDIELLSAFLLPRSTGVPRQLQPSRRPLRVAFLKTHVWETKASMSLHTAWRQAISLTLHQRSAIVTDLALPSEFTGHADYHTTLLASEARSSFLGHFISTPDKLDARIMQLIGAGDSITAEQMRAAIDGTAALRPRWDALAASFDVIVTPSVPDEAPKGLVHTGDASFCSLWTILHAPVVNVPGLLGEHGLPLGLSVVGARWEDWKVLESARWLGEVFKSSESRL